MLSLLVKHVEIQQSCHSVILKILTISTASKLIVHKGLWVYYKSRFDFSELAHLQN